ncbi:DUF4381 domain-containing protein [Algoriphagus aestuarii]|nr:DUF4381 domain-containing protein [Algoriphagus aestuarii]
MSFFQNDTLAANNPAVPIQDLGNIYEPPPVSFTFETIGWTVLGALLMIGLLVGIFFLIRHYLKNRYRREALAALSTVGSEGQNFPQVFVILKRVAIEVFGREKVGALFGSSWLGFLDKTGKNVAMNRYEKEINALIYQDQLPDYQVQQAILSEAKKWIRTHAG